jgi:hypothetical protein
LRLRPVSPRDHAILAAVLYRDTLVILVDSTAIDEIGVVRDGTAER